MLNKTNKKMKKVRAAIVGYGNIGRYVLEALQDEPGLTIEQVTLAENGGKVALTVKAIKGERRLTAEVALGQEGVTM